MREGVELGPYTGDMSNPAPPPGYLGVAPQGPPPGKRRRPERWVTIFLAAGALAALVVAFVWPMNSIDEGRPSCMLRLAVGLPCPGCGMTRAWVHMANGDVSGAFAYNLFGPIGFALAAILVGYVAWALIRRRAPERIWDFVSPRWVAVTAGLWLGYSAIRIVSLSMGYDTFDAVIS